MTAPTTRELEDDDYRAIARASNTFRVKIWEPASSAVINPDGSVEFMAGRDAVEKAELLNGRAAVAEYERRRK